MHEPLSELPDLVPLIFKGLHDCCSVLAEILWKTGRSKKEPITPVTIMLHSTQSFPKDLWPVCIHTVANQKANGLCGVHGNQNCIYLKTVGLGDIDDKEEFSPRACAVPELVLLWECQATKFSCI